MTNAITIYSSDAILTADNPPASQNAATVFLSGLVSAHSKRNMRRYLDQMAALLTGGAQDAVRVNWGALRFQHTSAIRAVLVEHGYKPATINVMLSALRGVLKSAWRLGQMSAEDYQRAVDLENVSGTTVPSGRNLASGEIMALADVCANDPTAAGIRDCAMVGLLYSCGMRRSELVSLDVADVDIDTGAIVIRHAKGRRERTAYATNGALNALTDWLEIRGAEKGALFLPINKGHKIIYTDNHGQPERLASQAVYDMLEKRGKQAGLKDFSPHDFRRTFVGDLLDKGVDISTAQQLAGHASVTTTQRYDRRGEATKRKAAEMIHFPYKRRKLV